MDCWNLTLFGSNWGWFIPGARSIIIIVGASWTRSTHGSDVSGYWKFGWTPTITNCDIFPEAVSFIFILYRTDGPRWCFGVFIGEDWRKHWKNALGASRCKCPPFNYIYIYIFNSHFTYTVTNISYYAVVHILKNGLSPNEAHFSIDAIFSPACPRRREERESLQRMASQSRSSEQSAREDHAMTTWRHDVTTWRFLFTKNWLLSEIFISHMNLYDNIWVEIQDLIVTLNRVWDTRKFG